MEHIINNLVYVVQYIRCIKLLIKIRKKHCTTCKLQFLRIWCPICVCVRVCLFNYLQFRMYFSRPSIIHYALNFCMFLALDNSVYKPFKILITVITLMEKPIYFTSFFIIFSIYVSPGPSLSLPVSLPWLHMLHILHGFKCHK